MHGSNCGNFGGDAGDFLVGEAVVLGGCHGIGCVGGGHGQEGFFIATGIFRGHWYSHCGVEVGASEGLDSLHFDTSCVVILLQEHGFRVLISRLSLLGSGRGSSRLPA